MIGHPYDSVGSLAAALRRAIADADDAQFARKRVERDIEDVLGLLFEDWLALFPTERAWRFSDPDGIHVYGVIDSPSAARALHLAGFRRVTAHRHLGNPEEEQDTCECETRVSDLA